AVAVGLKPVENPCISRSSKKPATEDKTGYKKPHTKQTIDPTAIIGTRPILSVSRPLKGLEIPAVRVNKAMISPLYSEPPIDERYAGSSGIIILKLAENSNELIHSNMNCIV